MEYNFREIEKKWQQKWVEEVGGKQDLQSFGK